MAITWTKGNTDPVAHAEDLIHEVIADESTYWIDVIENRVNGKIKDFFVRVNAEEKKEVKQ